MVIGEGAVKGGSDTQVAKGCWYIVFGRRHSKVNKLLQYCKQNESPSQHLLQILASYAYICIVSYTWATSKRRTEIFLR